MGKYFEHHLQPAPTLAAIRSRIGSCRVRAPLRLGACMHPCMHACMHACMGLAPADPLVDFPAVRCRAGAPDPTELGRSSGCARACMHAWGSHRLARLWTFPLRTAVQVRRPLQSSNSSAAGRASSATAGAPFSAQAVRQSQPAGETGLAALLGRPCRRPARQPLLPRRLAARQAAWGQGVWRSWTA